jgi:hypothetical protein
VRITISRIRYMRGPLPLSKTIYEIEPLLAECLRRSPWPAETPTAALRLPSLGSERLSF